MKFVWLSWWQLPEMPNFNLDTPWWISGYRNRVYWGVDKAITAILPGDNIEQAQSAIRDSFDNPKPLDIEWRYAEVQEGPPVRWNI